MRQRSSAIATAKLSAAAAATPYQTKGSSADGSYGKINEDNADDERSFHAFTKCDK